MRDLTELDGYRLRGKAVMDLWGFEGDATCGAFEVPSPIDRGPLRVIASGAVEDVVWEHLSVSRRNRTPNWAEMEHVRHLFARDDETWVQFHVPKSDHVNMHPYCLHMWRWTGGEFPRPAAILVGVGSEPAATLEEARAAIAKGCGA